MIHITEQQVRQHLSMSKAVELMEQAFRQLADGTAVNHPRQRIILPTGSILHYMAAGGPKYFGIKSYSSNPKTGAHFTFLLYRSEDGMPLASVEANALGQIRTGAVSGLATKLLAKPDAAVLGVIGTGFQAETQVHAMAAVRDWKEIRVWSRSAEKRAGFSQRFPFTVKAVETAQEAVEGADVVVTATNSKDPVLESAWISPGTHINAMGSNWANRRELPTDLVLRADLVVVDALDAGKIEAGDLLLAGLPESRWVELKTFPERTSADQITIFKSNGLAIEDVMAAGYVFEAVNN
jgi:ornithine cyclodeaminase/alanine dehydrogenase-like protein (mu-crystallin family)